MAEPLFRCFIPGRPIVKKNSQRVFGTGKRSRKVDSPQYSAWKMAAQIHINRAIAEHDMRLPIEGHIHLKAVFHFKNRMAEADLSNLYEGIQDVLQSMKVIRDDKNIQSHDGSRKVFGEKEGLEVEVYSFTSSLNDLDSVL